MANTTWNPADLLNVTLSGGNLIATASGAGGARSKEAVSSGKYFWEHTYTTINTNSIANGVALSTASLSTPSAGTSTILRINGNININGSYSGSTLGIISSGAAIDVAVDFAAKLIWYRIAPAGNWNGSGTANPATGAGGLSIAAIATGPLYALFSGGTSDKITANFGDSAFSGAVPSGFTAGFPAGAIVDLAGNLGDSSDYGKLSYGLKIYSRINAFAPTFAADVIVTPAINLSGDLAPVIVFAADLVGAPGQVVLAGGIAPQIVLGGPLTALSVDGTLRGSLPLSIVLGASMTAGPLWAASEPCPPPAWAESEPCPPSMWTPVPPPQWQRQNFPGSYGLAQYGGGPYNLQSDDPWYETEPCDGR